MSKRPHDCNDEECEACWHKSACLFSSKKIKNKRKKSDKFDELQ